MDINNLERFLEKTGRGEIAYGCCVTFADCAVTEVACAAGMDLQGDLQGIFRGETPRKVEI